MNKMLLCSNLINQILAKHLSCITPEMRMKNIFLEDKPMDTFDTFMKYDAQGRENLGDQIPVLIYRMLEYSLKFELQNRFDKETQVEVFRRA